MDTYRKKTRVGRCLGGLAHAEIALIVASIAVLAAGFADAIGSSGAEPQAEPDLAVPGEAQIRDVSGVGVAHSESELASAGQAEKTSEPSDVDAPSATFDERFYFDQPTSSFDDRFASAFGSSGNAAGKVAKAEDEADGVVPQQLDSGEQQTDKPPDAPSLMTSAPPSRRASLHEERTDTARPSFRLPLDSDSHTAIYDIAARTVYLPDGHRLEAHSGLGSHLDDPRFIKTRMQGPTPPNVYRLTLRERLFHGVRAIRLTPVDDGKMFGRDGILAHPYMLGPNGQSNGCVSFRNYPAFLDAFLSGKVDRLVVVDHLATTTSAKASAASGS